MLWRPAKWLIEKGLFSTAILPDRRGEGNSSPLTGKFSTMDHAQDMKLMLDELKINGKTTAIGLSYGGPISLQLASIDSRINEVILMASSPSLRDVKGFRGFLYRKNLLEPFAKMFYKKNLGKLPPEYPNFDGVYDLKTGKQLANYILLKPLEKQTKA